MIIIIVTVGLLAFISHTEFQPYMYIQAQYAQFLYYTDLDRSFVIPMFWESLGQAIARNLSYNHSILFKVASFESCR